MIVLGRLLSNLTSIEKLLFNSNVLVMTNLTKIDR